MSEVFLQLLNMSITAGWVVLGVVVLRLCFRRAPKWISVLLWGLVAVRLLLPFSIESALSLLPSGETVPHEILQAEKPAIQSGIPSVNAVVNPFLQDSFAPTPGNSVNPMQVVTEIAAWVWIVGVAGMMLYFFVSFFLLKRKLREAVLVKENIWACDGVDTPFLFGVFRPRIYLPSFLAEEDAAFVIAHEKAHLKRKDHLWKPLGFLLLAVYWFHPLLWVGYILLCKDIELACDEKVLRELGEQSKKPYSNALINCSASRKWISACPLAFGENGVKARVKSALHYKKPALWILIGAVLVTSFAAVWFLTDPPKGGEDIESVLEDLREQAVLFEDYTPSTEKLGECYYFYGEYESDRLFEDVKPLLEEKGYRLEDVGHLLEEGNDNPYYGAGNDTTGAGIWLVECATEEEAKKVYTAAMECSWEHDYRIQANFHYTITRMGRMVYGTVDTGAAFSDLMGIYDLPLPEPVPLYKGGKYTYWGFVGFEQAVTTAENMNYTAYGYNELFDEAPIVDCRNYLTPDGRGYLSIVKLTTLEEGFEGELPEDDPVVLYAYQTVAKVLFDLFGHGPELETAKYVMLSEDTFIAGTSYYVDAFIAELEK